MAVCACLLSTAGCATDLKPGASDPNQDDAAVAGSGSTAGAGGSVVYNNQSGAGGSENTLPDGGSAGSDASTGNEPGACGASRLAAEEVTESTEVEVKKTTMVKKPVTLFIMFDKSQSMKTSDLWEPAVAAMKTFIDSPQSNGIRVALQYFPLTDTYQTPASDPVCAGNDYKNPAVAAGLLPDQAAVFKTSLTNTKPDGRGTPIQAALHGVTDYCKQYQTDHPAEQCVAVLVTDGEPTGCEKDTNKLAAIAANALQSKVKTFAVGLQGADFTLLNAIGKAGGTDCDTNATDKNYACNVSSGADKLGEALNRIRDTVSVTETHTEIVKEPKYTKLPCEWSIPAKSAEGLEFDREKVNIRITQAGAATTLARAASLDSCKANGWYFDNADDPKRLIACPAVCDQIKAANDIQIDVLLGCATVVLSPD